MSVAEPRDLIEVLSRLEYWRQDNPEANQRSFRRFTVRGDANLEQIDTPGADCPPLAVMLRDISRGGAGFLCPRHLDRGSLWRINFQAHGMRVGSQGLSVRFSRLIQEGLYLIGGQFVIEPYILHALGVEPHQLADDVLTRSSGIVDSEFVSPPEIDQAE